MDSRDGLPWVGLLLAALGCVRQTLSAAVALNTSMRSKFSVVLPDPARAVPALDVPDFFQPPECATSPAAAAVTAMDAGKPLVVIAVSPLNPDCVALLAELSAVDDGIGAQFVTCIVDVTSTAMEPEIPAALRTAAALPAVAIYTPTRRGREFTLVVTGEGVRHATTVAAMMDEVLLRTHRREEDAADREAAVTAPADRVTAR